MQVAYMLAWSQTAESPIAARLQRRPNPSVGGKSAQRTRRERDSMTWRTRRFARCAEMLD